MRIGHGYDVHCLVKGRDCIIGGVNIPHDKGLLGHSDADVLLHAVMDSILGALCLGDIGHLFPDSDNTYKGADSLNLCSYVNDVMKKKSYKIGNIDATVIAQKPKMLPHIQKMRENIANVFETDVENISIKATTEEKLGFTGRLEGISAHAVCLLTRI